MSASLSPNSPAATDDVAPLPYDPNRPTTSPFHVFDVGCVIASYLDTLDLLSLAMVSKMANLCADDDELWLERLDEEFGVPITVHLEAHPSILDTAFEDFPPRTYKFAFRDEWIQPRRPAIAALRRLRLLSGIREYNAKRRDLGYWRGSVAAFPDLLKAFDAKDRSMQCMCARDGVVEQLKTTAKVAASTFTAHYLKQFFVEGVHLSDISPMAAMKDLRSLVNVSPLGDPRAFLTGTPWFYLAVGGAVATALYQRRTSAMTAEKERTRLVTLAERDMRKAEKEDKDNAKVAAAGPYTAVRTKKRRNMSHQLDRKYCIPAEHYRMDLQERLTAHLNFLIKAVNDTVLLHVLIPTGIDLGVRLVDTFFCSIGDPVLSFLSKCAIFAALIALIVNRNTTAAFFIVPLAYASQFLTIGTVIMKIALRLVIFGCVGVGLLSVSGDAMRYFPFFLYVAAKLVLPASIPYLSNVLEYTSNLPLANLFVIAGPQSASNIDAGTPSSSSASNLIAKFVYLTSTFMMADASFRTAGVMFHGRFVVTKTLRWLLDFSLQHCYLQHGLLAAFGTRVMAASSFVEIIALGKKRSAATRKKKKA